MNGIDRAGSARLLFDGKRRTVVLETRARAFSTGVGISYCRRIWRERRLVLSDIRTVVCEAAFDSGRKDEFFRSSC
mgnify:CR=1 FL=1